MSAARRTRVFSSLAAVLALMMSSGAAMAGWVTFKNETNRVIVVQWSVESNGQVKRCRPVRLLPGESVREFRNPHVLSVEVYDDQKPTRLLHTGNLKVGGESQAFSVNADGRTVSIAPVKPR